MILILDNSDAADCAMGRRGQGLLDMEDPRPSREDWVGDVVVAGWAIQVELMLPE